MPAAGQQISTDNIPVRTLFSTSKRIYWAQFSGSTDPSGVLQVTHGLGFAPSVVYAQSRSGAGTYQFVSSVPSGTITSTVFDICWRRSDTGAAFASLPVAGFWIAFE